MLKILLISLSLVFISSCENKDQSGTSTSYKRLESSITDFGSGNSDFTRDLNGLMDGPTSPDCSESAEDEDNTDNQVIVDADEESLFENYKKLGGDPIAFKQAMCFFKTNGDKSFKAAAEGYEDGIKIENQRYITIQDFNMESTQKRLFILDRQTGKVEAIHSGHGAGQSPRKNGQEKAMYFGNEEGSKKTPTGFFITGNTYNSDKSWQIGMRLHGLQTGVNDNTFRRGVVFHKSSYTPSGKASSDDSPPTLSSSSPSGRSEGCTTVNPSYSTSLMSKLAAGKEGRHPYKGGALFYNYGPSEKKSGASYCGHALALR